MPTVKLNISLDRAVAEVLRSRASEAGKPTSRYMADLIREDDRRRRDALAEEGYALLSVDTNGFAEAALPVALETWPEWQDQESTDGF